MAHKSVQTHTYARAVSFALEKLFTHTQSSAWVWPASSALLSPQSPLLFVQTIFSGPLRRHVQEDPPLQASSPDFASTRNSLENRGVERSARLARLVSGRNVHIQMAWRPSLSDSDVSGKLLQSRGNLREYVRTYIGGMIVHGLCVVWHARVRNFGFAWASMGGFARGQVRGRTYSWAPCGHCVGHFGVLPSGHQGGHFLWASWWASRWVRPYWCGTFGL